MKIIILGAGQVGQGIAKYLADDDNQVILIDKNKELLDKLAEKLDIQTFHGFASHPGVLSEIQIDQADILVAVTSSDEVNIVACEVAKSINENITTIARVRHSQYFNSITGSARNPKIDVTISPEIEVAQAISRNALVPGSFDVISLCDNAIKIIGVRCKIGAPILNTPIKLIPSLFPNLDLRLFCIKRDQNSFFPHDDECLYEGDEVYLMVKEEDLYVVMEVFGFDQNKERQLLIIGGGRIGCNLALQMENETPEIITKIIEKDPKISEENSTILKQTEIICGDALDHEVLQDIGLENFETVISVTNDDKVNILSALIAKRQSKARTLILLNNMSYTNLVHSLGVDSVVVPRSLTISTILRHLQKGEIQSINALGNDYLIVSAKVQESSFILGLTSQDVNIEQKITILCMKREGRIQTQINKIIFGHGDELVLASTKESLSKVEKLFSQRPDYL